MALQIWMPLNGNIDNQGLSNIDTVNLNATSNTAGKIGRCYYFNGTNARIYANSVDLSNTEMSCCCWAKFESLDNNNYPYLISLGDGGTGVTQQIGIFVYKSDKKVTICGNGTEMKTSYVVTTNVWYHFCMIYTGTVSKLYINGNEVYSGTSAGKPTKRSGFCIGARASSASGAGAGITYPMQGWMNDVRVYDHALSPREIKEISKGLVLHYPLNREGFGADNLLSRYVSPGQQNPGVTDDKGRTKYYGDYGIIIPATENADTYFRLFLRKQLINNATYTISCHVSGLVDGTFYAFPLFAQGNVSMGSLLLNHNGLNSMTFTMTYGTQTAVTVGSETVYICFMDDANRSIATGQGPITVTHFKIEEGSTATPFVPAPTDALYTKMGLDDNIVYDTSGYKYNGTVVDGGISYSSDTVRYNVSAEFDGVNSAIAIPWSTFYKQGDVFTLNLWWKKSSLGSKNYETLFGGSGIEMDTRAGGASTLSLYMASTRGGNLYTPFSFNEWYMNTLVNDGTNELYYVNGQLVKTIEKKNMPTGTCYIGAWTSHTSQNYKGLISDFRIYKTALSADDILELYHTPVTLSNNGTLMTQGEYVEV